MLTEAEVRKIQEQWADMETHFPLLDGDIEKITSLADTCLAAMDGLTLRERENEVVFKTLKTEIERANKALARVVAAEEALAEAMPILAKLSCLKPEYTYSKKMGLPIGLVNCGKCIVCRAQKWVVKQAKRKEQGDEYDVRNG